MMNGRTLALIGIGLYLLRVLTSGVDANGITLAPDTLILLSGTASIIYVIIAGVALWNRNAKRIAWALPITFAFAFDSVFLTPTPSSLNVVLNALRVIALLTYFYAAYVLFTSDEKRLASDSRASRDG